MKRLAEQGIAALGVFALFLATGCNGFFVYPGSVAGGGTGSSTSDYVFVANATTETLAVFTVGTGTLTAVSGSPFALGFVPEAVVVNPANTIVYVSGGNGVSNVINAYSIGSGGVLSLLTSNTIGLSSEVSIAISPDGQWLMGLNSLGATESESIVDEYQIVNSSGTLQLESNAGGVYSYSNNFNPVPVLRAWSIKFAPNGAEVFAAMGTGGDVVFPFTTANGTFSTPLLLPPISTTTSDQALAVSSGSTYLYIARNGSQGGLAVYAIGSGGGLSPISGSPFAAGSQPISVALNQGSTDAYIANQGDSTISGYGVASNGAVSILSPATISTYAAPSALAVDNSGNYLLAISTTADGSYDLSMYSYDSTTAGKLDFVTSSTTGVDPTGPVAIATTH
jgi:6-phosphogluconolactonase